MPQDASCPKCKNSFPVTEARNAFTVACPKCDAEMTVEFKKPAAPPEAGQPHYDLLVKPGALVSVPVPPPAKKKKNEDDEDEPKRKGGSAAVVLLSGGFGLLFVLGGLGLTAWILFAEIGRKTAANTTTNTNTNRPNQPNPPRPNPDQWNPGPAPVIPAKPKDEFELKPVAGQLQAITPPANLQNTTMLEFKLPGPAGAVSVGGNGRYVVLHIPSTKQLVCFDASKGLVFPGPEPAPDGNLMLAAGQNRLAVLGPNNILSVYDLPSLQRRYDASGPPLPPHNATSLAMGSATNGPLLACTAFGEVVLMDIGANAATPIEGSKGNIGGDLATPVRASASGKVFVRGGFGNDNKTVLASEFARKWRAINSEVGGGYPSADGRYVFGYGMIVRDSGQQLGNRAPAGVWYVPAVSGHHFLRLTETRDAGRQSVSVSVHKNHNNPQTEKTASIALPEGEGLVGGWGVALDQHLFLIPEAKMLVTLTASKDKLVMRKIDIK